MKAPNQNVTFEQLIAKVKRAEDLLETRERRAAASYRRLKKVWREGWTPLRIVSAGLVGGFLVGRAEPLGAVGGARILQMVTTVSSLLASAQASFAAEQAEEAADTVEEVATDQASGQVGSAPVAARMSQTRDQVHSTQPRPAEAATEVSEP